MYAANVSDEEVLKGSASLLFPQGGLLKCGHI